MTLKMLDTFAGIGGFSYAAKYLIDGGIDTAGFVEIDPFCQKVLSKNFPNIPIYDDITTFTARPFQYDIISGGFPCQDISVAGRQKGITKTTRSGLFYELIRVIRMVRPKYIILENVSAILNNGLDIVLAELYEAGPYECEWATFPASLIGAAHQRDRFWLVGKIADTDNYGQQRREYETRNKIITRQNSQSEWSANTNHTKRQSNDGDDIGQSRIDENLSRSSDGGKTTSSETGGICELSEGTDNNQEINRENNNQEDNDRALVSQGQSRVQLSIDTELGRDQTTLKNNSIRQGDDNSSEQRVDNQNRSGDVTDSNKNGSSRTTESRSTQETNGGSEERKDISIKSEGGSKSTNSRDFQLSVADTESSTWDEHEVERKHGEVETQEISRNGNSSGDTRESITNSNSNDSQARSEQLQQQRQTTFSSTSQSTTSNPISKGVEKRISGFNKELQETGSTRSSDSSSDRRSTTNSNSIRTQSKDEGYNPSWKVPVGNGETRQTLSPKWRGYVSEPCLRRGDDGLRGRMDRLKALGNSVVPQCAAIPLQRVIQLEREQQ